MATDKILVKVAKNAELKVSEAQTIVKKIVTGTTIRRMSSAAGFNAGTLAGESAGYYLDFTNLTNVPTILDSGDVLALFETSDIDNLVDSGSGVSILGPVKVTDHIIPDSDETIDLGSPTNKFRSLYLSAGTLYVGSVSLSDSGGEVILNNVDSAGDIIPNSRKVIATGLLTQITDLTTIATDQVVDTFSLTEFRSVKYLVQLEHDSDSKYHTQEILLTHNGTNVFLTEYAEVKTDSSLGTFDASIVDSNVTLTLSPSYTNTHFKSKRLSVDA